VEALRAGQLDEAEDWLGRAVKRQGPEAPARYWFAWGVAQMKQATELAGPHQAAVDADRFTSATAALKAALSLQQAARPPAPTDLGTLGLLTSPRTGGPVVWGMPLATRALLDEGPTYASPDTVLRLPPAVEGRLDEGPTNACLAYCAARLQVGKRLGPAMDMYVKAIQAGHRTAEVWNNLAVCLGRDGRTAEATVLVQRALALKPDLTPAVYNRAILAYQARNAEGFKRPGKRLPPQALDDIQTVLSTKPAGNHPYFYASLLYAYASLDLAPRDAATKARYRERSLECLRLALERGYRGDIQEERVFKEAFGPGFATPLPKGRAPGDAPAGGSSAPLELAQPAIETLLTP
jgi:tetratricopeptide (TPR) repeat protein